MLEKRPEQMPRHGYSAGAGVAKAGLQCAAWGLARQTPEHLGGALQVQTSEHNMFSPSAVPGKEGQVHGGEQDCSCLQHDRFVSNALLILTFTSNS